MVTFFYQMVPSGDHGYRQGNCSFGRLIYITLKQMHILQMAFCVDLFFGKSGIFIYLVNFMFFQLLLEIKYK